MKHFLSLADVSPEEIWHLLDLAIELKEEWQRGGNRPLLKGKTLGMIFQKPSLRTRVSFDMAMLHLGGQALYLSPNEIQLGVRESVPDVARVLSRYVDAIMARVFAHSDVVTLAEYSRVPVINGLSDYEHPCQGLADFLTIIEKKGRDLRGRKLAFVGDGNNVATALLFGATKLGMDFAIATPPGYELPASVWELGQKFAAESGSHILATHDPVEAVREADVIYTDVWASMGQEAEAEARAKVFPPYQVNAALVAKAKPDVIVMHCLPAHRGQEITDDVADGPHSVLWDQAENRMHAQKAILVELIVGRE
ncbi:MAG: ornithine carbamoyltransferase [Chloroflexi bacterium]|jgi:ornithine carbamoyltransferase|nr:ornithine carbamoyltransferase [Chloroflexota bacterium]